MDDMNDTMRMMIKAIIQIIKDSKDKDEALKKNRSPAEISRASSGKKSRAGLPPLRLIFIV